MKSILTFAILILTAAVYAANIKVENFNNRDMNDSTSFTRKKYNEGIMFYATGNEPFWSLDINKENALIFKTLNGDKLLTPPVEPVKAMDANIKSYSATTESGSLKATIIADECIDNMSGQKFGYKVEVQYKPEGSEEVMEFKGCGSYVPDYALEGKWKLKKIGDEFIVDSVYSQKFPFIEFRPDEMQVGGVAGCNNIRGAMWQEADKLRFTNMISTLMACPEEMREREILMGLNSTTSYKLEGNLLTLLNPDGKLLVYEKEQVDGGQESDDSYRLHDIWVLENIGGKEVGPKDFMKEMPRLEIKVEDRKYFGNTGCNNMFGEVEINGESLKFGPAATTRMMCPGDYEQQFLKALTLANKWKVENMKLYLYEGDNELMILKKVD